MVIQSGRNRKRRPVFWQFETRAPEDDAVRALAQIADIGGGASDPNAISVEGHRAQIEVAAAIRENRPPAILGSEARRAVRLIGAIHESSRENRVVPL